MANSIHLICCLRYGYRRYALLLSSMHPTQHRSPSSIQSPPRYSYAVANTLLRETRPDRIRPPRFPAQLIDDLSITGLESDASLSFSIENNPATPRLNRLPGS